MSPRNTCSHPDFMANVEVARLEDKGRFTADVTIRCAACGAPMRFLGLPMGLDLNGAAVSVDGTEARLAIHPLGEPIPEFSDDEPAGFRVLSQTNIREEPVPQELILRSIVLRAETINEEARTVDAVLATSTRATVFDMRNWRNVEEVLLIEGCEPPAQMPFFDSHPQLRGPVTTDDMRGSIRNLRIEKGQLVGTIHAAEDEDSDKLWKKIKGGHVTDISTGNVPIEVVELAPGTTEVVQGKKYKAGELPLLITTRWRPREGSACPWGADPKAKIRTEGPPPRNPETAPVPANLRAYLESIGLTKGADEAAAWNFYHNLRGEQLTHAETLRGEVQPPARTTPPTVPVTPPAQLPANPLTNPANVDVTTLRNEAVTQERARVQRIEELGGTDVPREIVRQAITEGWDEARTSREFLTIVRTRRTPPVPGAPAIHSRGHEADCTQIALEAACLIRANLDPVDNFVRYQEGSVVRFGDEAARRQQVEQAAELAWRYRDLSMIDLCREAIRLDQRNCPHSRQEIIRTAISGGSLTNIFTTTVGAQLLVSYEAAVDTTVGWVREAEVPNFQTNERIQLGKGAALKKLPRGKKAAHTSLGDRKEEYKIARYANQFVADEQDFIDDNFGALLTMPEEMGEAAAQLRPDLVYAILLANAALSDGYNLFDATNHGNLRTGAALAAPTLKVAITDMSIQKDNGRTLNLTPFGLLVPKGLKHTASELINSTEIRDTTASKERGTRNALLDDQLTMVSDARLDNGVTDPATETVHAGSATTWFLVCKAGRYTIEVGYLRGTGRSPQLRSFVLDKGQWGMGWDINMDIGAKALDHKGFHKDTA